MATTMAPKKDPKRKRSADMRAMSLTKRSKGEMNADRRPEINITMRVPNLCERKPVTGSIRMAPAPSKSRRRPRSLSFRFKRSLAKGTIGAQLERANPHTKKTACVALFAFCVRLISIDFFSESKYCLWHHGYKRHIKADVLFWR